MLTPEEEMQILKGALTQGYKGQVFKLIDQANLQKGQIAETDSQQEQGLKGSDGTTTMSFPETEENFNTEGMNFPVDIRKYDREGNLVKSYNKVPPGIKELDMGEDEGTVIENPSQYKEGGIKQYQEEEFKEYQTGGVDLNFGAEGSMNCGPGTGRNCGYKESRITLKPNFNMSYNTGTKDIGGSLGLGLQSYLGGYDTRGGAPTIEAGIRGEGSVNALTLESQNPETHTNLMGYGKIGYTKRGTPGAHDWSGDNAGFNVGAYGDYDLSAKKMKELGIYGGYGKIQGNLGYNLQNKQITTGIGFRLKEGGLRKYQNGGFDKNAFIDQYLKDENKTTSNIKKNKGILSNTISTTQGTKYYNKDGTPMTFEEQNVKILSDKKATKKYVKKSADDITEFLSDPINIADAAGMTGLPVLSEAGDLVSAGISTFRGNYGDAGLSLAGITVPFAGGAILKQSAKASKYVPDHALYRVVDASGNVEAAKFGSTIPDATTSGRRSGIQGTIQKNTDFDHISATTDQKWITEGKSNLFDRYGGKNPYVVKLQGHEGKIHQIAENATSSDLAKIRPGSYTNMKVAGPQHQEIVSILGPKGGKVANVKGVMSKSQYMDALRLDPNFKFKKGGVRKYQTGNFKAFDPTQLLPKIETPKEEMSREEMLRRQRFQESSFDSNAISPAGAMGIAQFMPITISHMKEKGIVKDNFDPYNPTQAIEAQDKYMNWISKRPYIKGDKEVKKAKTLAGYNMGAPKLRIILNKMKADGIDIYNNEEWIRELPNYHRTKKTNEPITESRDYVNRILFGKGNFEEQYSEGLTMPGKSFFIKKSGGYRSRSCW